MDQSVIHSILRRLEGTVCYTGLLQDLAEGFSLQQNVIHPLVFFLFWPKNTFFLSQFSLIFSIGIGIGIGTGIGIGICIGIGINQSNLIYRKSHTGQSKTSK